MKIKCKLCPKNTTSDLGICKKCQYKSPYTEVGMTGHIVSKNSGGLKK